jgi:hypothetical protein
MTTKETIPQMRLHGTYTSYVKTKCRCKLCKAANAQYQLAYYYAKKAEKAEASR